MSMSAIPTTALSITRAAAGSASSTFAHKLLLHSEIPNISSFLMLTKKTTSSPAP